MGKAIVVLSLDISSTSSGWTIIKNNKLVAYGTIKPSKKFDISEKLVMFRVELSKIISKHKPTEVVIENGFLGINAKVLKVLMKFSGVAIELVRSSLGISPYIMSNKVPKAYFGVTTKENLFEVINSKYFKNKSFTFEEHNDITDSFAQNICYIETVLNKKEG